MGRLACRGPSEGRTGSRVRRALVVLALACLSCGRSPLLLGIDHRMGDDREGVVEGAAFAWNDLAGWTWFRSAEDGTPDVWVTERIPRAPGANGSYYDGEARIRPGLPLDQFAYAVRHELGHALGLKHTAAGVMRKDTATAEFSPDDREECRREGVCE